MGVQYRGCSHLYYAIETEAADGTLSYGTPKQLAPVKSVSFDVADDNASIYADNILQEKTYGAKQVTRTFETIRIDPEVAAEVLGNTVITVGTKKAIATRPDGSTKPYIAIGVALYDADPAKPCEIYWAYHCKVNSISKSSNTIDDGTDSQGQSIEIVNIAPKKAWTTTGRRELDFDLLVPDETTASEAATLLETFFEQVVTLDNASTVLA